MNFHARKFVKPCDLNPSRNLFGGRLLLWIAEESALYTIVKLDKRHIVTKFTCCIGFTSGEITCLSADRLFRLLPSGF